MNSSIQALVQCLNESNAPFVVADGLAVVAHGYVVSDENP